MNTTNKSEQHTPEPWGVYKEQTRSEVETFTVRRLQPKGSMVVAVGIPTFICYGWEYLANERNGIKYFRRESTARKACRTVAEHTDTPREISVAKATGSLATING